MAQYTVTAGCGHRVEIKLFGKETERKRRLDWMASPTGKCNTCYATMKRQEEAAERDMANTEEAAQLAAKLMQATPDQVDQFRQQMRQAEILNSPKAAVAARALMLYEQALRA